MSATERTKRRFIVRMPTREVRCEHRPVRQDGRRHGLHGGDRLCDRRGPCRDRRHSRRQRAHAGQGRRRHRGDPGGCAGSETQRRRRRPRHGGGLRSVARGGSVGRHPRQQRRYFRSKALLRHPRCRLEPLLRGQRHVGRPPVARLSQGHDGARLGTRGVPVLRIGRQHPTRHAALRLHQDGHAGYLARARQAGAGHGRDGQRRVAGTDADRGRRTHAAGSGRAGRQDDRRGGRAIRQGQAPVPRSSSGWRARARSPAWWSISARNKPRRLPEPPCASTAGRSIRSSDLDGRRPMSLRRWREAEWDMHGACPIAQHAACLPQGRVEGDEP